MDAVDPVDPVDPIDAVDAVGLVDRIDPAVSFFGTPLVKVAEVVVVFVGLSSMLGLGNCLAMGQQGKTKRCERFHDPRRDW